MGSPRFDDIAGEDVGKPSAPAGGPPRFDDIEGQHLAPAPNEDPGLLTSLAHKALSGFSKRWSDELVGAITQARVTPDPEGSVQWRDPSSPTGTRPIRTPSEAWMAGRNSERETLKAAEKYHPTASTLAEIGGDVASDLALGAFGVPVGSPAYQALSGAVNGAGSAKEVGDVPGQALVGGTLGYVLPKVGGVVLKRAMARLSGAKEALVDSLGQRIKGAEGEIAERAADKLQEQAGQAWGPYGQKVAEMNRALEIVDRRFPGATDEQIATALTREGTPITGEAITGMRDQLFKANAEKMGRIGGELAKSKSGWDAFKAAAPELEAQLVKLEGSVAGQVVPWVKRYGPPVVGSFLGGPAGGVAGMAMGGGADAAVGALAGAGMRPALQATLRRVGHPAMRKAALEALQWAVRGAEAAGGAAAPAAEALTRPTLSEALDAMLESGDEPQRARAKALRRMMVSEE
jgi:hypothetical protein